MSVEKTLARVEADLSTGDVAMACQRLRGLVGSYPDRLDLRGRLAQVYRQQGNRVQAGRWDYLADDPDAAEVAAFEKATPSPVHRMRTLAWASDPRDAPTPAARQRLAAVLAEARERTGNAELTYQGLRARWATPESGPTGGCVGRALVLVVVPLILLLFVVGVLDGLRVIWSWLT